MSSEPEPGSGAEPERGPSRSPGFGRGSLARRYLAILGGLSLALLLASAVSEMIFGYREARGHIAQLQRLQAHAAAREIERYLGQIELSLRDAGKLGWSRTTAGRELQREELHRQMVLLPAVIELGLLDSQGRELLFVSRTEPDRQSGPSQPAALALLSGLALDAARYGPTFSGAGGDPQLHLLLAGRQADAPATMATLNLRFLADVLAALPMGERGRIYLFDAQNRLIAHPRPSHILRQADLSRFEPLLLARARQAGAAGGLLDAVDTVDLDGQPVISTALSLERTGWLLLIEQARSEALLPVLATLQRTALLMLLGAALAVLASVVLARRLAGPIVKLRQATARIAAGDLQGRIQLRRPSEELQGLADDFRHMAAELAASQRGLEQQVLARTLELSQARDRLQIQAQQMDGLNQRLQEQLAEAERANAAKTRFLAAASHDLRQPMHSIGLLVGVLGESLREPAQQHLAGKVSQAVLMMEDLFESLLDISKLDAGLSLPERESFALDAVLSRVEQAFAPQAAARGLRLRRRPCGRMVVSAPAWIERIVGNLLANALRYTSSGGVLLGCRQRGAELLLQVWDSGCGIPAEHLQLVFEEFVRLDGPDHGHAKGLGLGLSIVKRSADLLGHVVSVRSRPGRGSVFEIRLPLAAPSMTPGLAEALGPQLREDLAGVFVLIVDDDEDGRRALEAACRQWGCLVESAASAEQARLALQQHLRGPDLLVSDQQLGPGASGLELVAWLREELDEALPALLITANTAAELARQAAAMQVPLLHKPAGTAKVLQAMVAALGRRRDKDPE